MTTINSETTFIGLDVGDRRIGVARVHSVVRIAEPLQHIEVDSQDVFERIKALITEYSASGVVVGLPRGLDGQETSQTAYSRKFAEELQKQITVPVYLIDEAGTSKAADDRIGKNNLLSRDSVAAAILLEDFVSVHNQEDLRVL
jgi:putative Holliday junction resolvase